MTMDVELNINSLEATPAENMAVDNERDNIINFLVQNKSICFKSQQKWEADLTVNEKSKIAMDIFENNKLNFLLRFGKYLQRDHLNYFKQFTENNEPDSGEIDLVLKDLYRNASESTHHIDVKNRRFTALMEMVEEDSYFSEIEMMKRNPLLYEQLVGQYLTDEEKKERDKYEMNDEATLVKILMEGIERSDAEAQRKNEEEREHQMKEEDSSDETESRSSSPAPSTSRWGEFEDSKRYRPKPKIKPPSVTTEERLLLKEEFITTMYQNFLDGKDKDFNYEAVDNNSAYDDFTEMDHNEEDKYFASEDPEVLNDKNNVSSSEDELEIYMNALNQHPAVIELSNDLKNL